MVIPLVNSRDECATTSLAHCMPFGNEGYLERSESYGFLISLLGIFHFLCSTAAV